MAQNTMVKKEKTYILHVILLNFKIKKKFNCIYRMGEKIIIHVIEFFDRKEGTRAKGCVGETGGC